MTNLPFEGERSGEGGTPAGEDATVIVTTGCASFLPALAKFYEVSIRRSRDENKKRE